jgi:hypothetical protein
MTKKLKLSNRKPVTTIGVVKSICKHYPITIINAIYLITGQTKNWTRRETRNFLLHHKDILGTFSKPILEKIHAQLTQWANSPNTAVQPAVSALQTATGLASINSPTFR